MFTGFDPDPDIADPDDEYFGTGVWTYDDGTSMYGQGDRDEALSLWQRPDAPMGPPPVPGQGVINGADKIADFTNPSAGADRSPEGPPPMIARPPEPVSTPVDGANGSRPADETPGIRIPRESRIAWVHNNPGNLKYVGQEGATRGEPAEDGGHWAAFETPEEGLAALQRQVELDAGRGQTVSEFINKYAPPSSNDTATYVKQATEALGVGPDAKLSDVDRSRLLAFVAQKESGTELGATSLPEQAPPPRAPGSSLPSSLGGMPAVMAEVRGAPLSPEQLQQRQQGVYDSTMTQVAGVQRAAEARQQGREEALEMVRANSEAFKADKLRQLAQAQATRAEAERNVQQAMATQLDPGRVVKGMSTGDMLLGALALALGGIGQTLQQRAGNAGARNVVLPMIEKALADDLEAQKDDKKSRVAHWTRVFDDAQMGERAARAELYNAAGRYAEYQAQHRAQNADIQAQMLQDSATLLAKGQQEVQALADRENERLSIRYAPPEPPVGGNPAAALRQSLAARKAYEDAGATPEQLAALDKALGLPTPAGESVRAQKTREDAEARAIKAAELTESEGKAEAAWESLAQLGAAFELQKNPQTGQYVDPGGLRGMQAPGLQEVVPGFFGSGKPIEAARQVAIDALARLQTGAAISKEEEERFSTIIADSSTTRSQLATNLNAIRALIESRRKANRIGAPGAPAEWE